MNRQTVVSALDKRRTESFLRLVIARYGHRETAQLLREANALAEKETKARSRSRAKAYRACQKRGDCYGFK